MDRYFTKTFFKFFFAFLIIIAVAFGVLLFTASQTPGSQNPQGQIAQPAA
jgi:lipopolysaccharide export LptBFGC system permease protein LptF